MKKRDYSFKSILLVLIVTGALGMFVGSAFENEETILSILGPLIGVLGDFAISRGLIVNRKGSFKDYFGQIKNVNLNFFLVNILFSLIGVLLVTLMAGLMVLPRAMDMASIESLETSLRGSAGPLIAYLILIFLLSMLTAYTNFVVADPRNEDLTVIGAFKKVLKTGTKLFAKTFKTMLKFVVLPIVIYIIILMLLGLSQIGEQPSGGALISIILAVLIFFVGIFVFLIKLKAEISDHYLNLYGDYKIEYKSPEEDQVKLTRKVDLDDREVIDDYDEE